MPYRVVEFQETPNPNALRCVVDRVIAQTPRSFFSGAQAADDPLASRLFAIDGVVNVLILNDFVTVSKSPAAAWKTLRPAIQRVLDGAC